MGKPMMDLEPPFPHISWKTSHFYALFLWGNLQGEHGFHRLA